jgi:hypothetical protein
MSYRDLDHTETNKIICQPVRRRPNGAFFRPGGKLYIHELKRKNLTKCLQKKERKLNPAERFQNLSGIIKYHH